jgi:crotonobetainyl-CoA:carnitine CoA-transferase CaiB-like acyl-CoA transferase
MAALVDARDTGTGRLIDLSMTEAVAGLLDDFVVQAQLEDTPWTFGSQPDPVYSVECGDGEWLAVSLDDALAARSQGATVDSIRASLQALAAGSDRATLEMKLTELGIRTSPVLKASDVLREPPVPGFWTEIDHAEVGPRQYVTPPFRFEPEMALRSEPAPLHAEHTSEVLRKFLRLNDAELDQLRADGVVL